MTRERLLSIAGILCFFVMVFAISCTKNATPTPPVHDTVTVIKHDTTIKNDTTVKNDTLYATKPDPTVNLTKGLLLWLNFSGNIADSSGNGNPTQAIGNVLTYDASGYANNAFGATGNGEEVVVTNNGSIQFDTAFSISFGFMVNGAGTHSFMSMVNPVNGYGATFDLGMTLPASPHFSFGVGESNGSCNNIVNNPIVDTTTFTPIQGSWYNCICIYHRGGVQVYINGTLRSSKQGTGTAALLCPSSQFIVGGWWNGDNLSMNGKLDNIRMYNRVLTPHEIIQLSASYQVTSNIQRPGLRTR